jgi:hypothetical protein
MIELLKGRISDTDGLQEVLEIMSTFKEVSTGVLDVDSDELSGRIGIAWGKFITGALINDTEEKGKKALRKLLRLRAGKFVFWDFEDEKPIAELRQTLGIDLVRTATVVPDLDPKEAHFLWGMDETVGSEDDEDDEDDEHDEVSTAPAELVEEPEEDDEKIYDPQKADDETAFPNLSTIRSAVATSDWNADPPVPEVSQEEYKHTFELPKSAPEPSYMTPALDAVFGSSPSLDAIPPFSESGLPNTFDAPQPRIQPEEPREWIEPEERPQSIFEQHSNVDTFEMKAPEPASEPLPIAPLTRAPMLQPSVVADEKFIGQRYVEPPGKLRPSPSTDSSSIGIAVFCVLLFVVSCAGTVILGPRAWEFITSVLHI